MVIANLSGPLEALLEARNLVRRYSRGQAFRRYLLARLPLVVPALALFFVLSLACAAGIEVFLADRSPWLALPGLLLAPFVLIGSLFVQGLVFFLWLEQRAFGHRAKIQVPWVLAGVLVFLPAAVLAVLSLRMALVLLAAALLAPLAYDRLDR